MPGRFSRGQYRGEDDGVSFRLDWDIVLVTAYDRIPRCCREGGTRSAPDGKDEPWTRGCWLS